MTLPSPSSSPPVRTATTSWFGTLLASCTLALFPSQTPAQAPPANPPEPAKTSITVTENVAAESPAPITVLDSTAIGQSPGTDIDDRLRLFPGFTLFRRTSSLVANPTTQGVSLRGLGSNGASRTLVLWDGFPLNSPFGGWVYWTRIDPDALDRVEISESAATSLFGDRAMGGALALFEPEPRPRHLTFAYEGGNHGANEIDAGGSYVFRERWAVSADSRDFTTDGWYIVPDNVRGPVDRPADLSFAAATVRLDYLGASDRVFLRADVLAEDRGNGTVLQKNSTGAGTLAASWSHQSGADTFSALGWYTVENFHATYSAINAARTVERLTSTQSVPAYGSGGAAYWRRAGSRWNLLAGGDFNRSEGYSREVFYPGGLKVTGGALNQGGAFAQGDVSLGRVRFYAGFRGEDASGFTFWSPSGGVTAGFGHFRLRASANRAFRAPTLNELYRNFRVGNVITLANAALRPETLDGAEAGADWLAGKTTLSLTLYRNALDGLITNATLSTTPSLITRQRENLASATARGIESKFARTLGPLRFEAAYLFADSRVSTGPRLPQVPKQQGTAQLVYQRKSTLLAAGLRASGLQFEDDLNSFLLPGYAVFHCTARQSLPRGFALDFQLENAFNRVVVAGYSPTPLVGSPRLVRAGVRWTLP